MRNLFFWLCSPFDLIHEKVADLKWHKYVRLNCKKQVKKPPKIAELKKELEDVYAAFSQAGIELHGLKTRSIDATLSFNMIKQQWLDFNCNRLYLVNACDFCSRREFIVYHEGGLFNKCLCDKSALQKARQDKIEAFLLENKEYLNLNDIDYVKVKTDYINNTDSANEATL